MPQKLNTFWGMFYGFKISLKYKLNPNFCIFALELSEID